MTAGKPSVTPSTQLIPPKAKPYFASVDECETYVAWKQRYSNQKTLRIKIISVIGIQEIATNQV